MDKCVHACLQVCVASGKEKAMSTTAERYEATLQQVHEACARVGRSASDVTLVAVSKTVGLEEVADAILAGACDFGENRPDELMRKHDAFPNVNWHFIGNIQSRRIRDIVGRALLIHSLYEQHHAQKIEEIAAEQGITQDVLIEVNVSGEASKSGLAPDEVADMLAFCESLAHVRPRGLMTMAPQGDLQAAREAFRGLRELRDQLRATLPAEQAAVFRELSMGMSEDWPCALEEGSSFIRIGRAIFSEDFTGHLTL